MNFQMFKLVLEKAEEPEIDQIANICWIIEKARDFQKNIYFCFIDHAKSFDCVDHNTLCKSLKDMGIPDHLMVTTAMKLKDSCSFRRKVMTNLDSIFKSRDTTLPTKVCLVKSKFFSSSHVWM